MTDRAKNIAGVSLGVMAVGFAATLPFPGGVAIPLLQSGFEAGLVGGLADWFAITALFRHPLGIPIPHTAIMPKNRAKVTNALVAVIENDLLNKETINEKIIQQLNVDKMIQALEKGMHTEPFKQGLVAVSQFILENIPVDKVAAFLANEVSQYIRALNTESIIQTIVKEALHRGYEEKAFDFILEKTEEIISRDEIRDQIGSMGLKAFEKLQLGGLMQFAVNAFMGYLSEEKLGDILQGFILNGIRDLSDQNHPTRAMLLDEIRKSLTQASEQDKLLREIEAWKEQLLKDWNVEGKISSLLEGIRHKALVFIHEDRYREEVMVSFITQTIDRMKAQPDMIARFEGWIHQQIYRFVEENHQKIGKLVRENVDKLDNETLIALMEDKLGKDLQWIRVNGALCGFLIGLLLGGIKLLTS